MDISFWKKFSRLTSKKRILKLCIFFTLLVLSQVVQVSARSFPESDYMGHNHDQHGQISIASGHCRQILYATQTAQMISIPKSEDPNNITYCEWTIKAHSSTQKIGFATVNNYLDFFQSNSFCIEIYDGPSAEYNKLSYWYGRDNFHPRHFVALTSSSDSLFINYTARGGPIDLHMDLVYYLCGGKANSGTKIGSPIFDRKTPFEVPDVLECSWILEKPADISYGLLQFYSIRVPDCETLAVTTDNGRLITVYNADDFEKNKTLLDRQNETDEFAVERRKWQESYSAPEGNFSEASESEVNSTSHAGFHYEPPKLMQEIQICNSSIQGVMFNGSNIILTFIMLYPEKKYGFTGMFQFLKLPDPKLKSNSDNAVRSWFINYGALVFCSVGIVVGCIIMYIQARRWSKHGNRRSYVNDNVRNNVTASRNTRTNYHSNSEHGHLTNQVLTPDHLTELREEPEYFLSEECDETDFMEEPFLPNGFSKHTLKNPSQKRDSPIGEFYYHKPCIFAHKRAASDSEILTDHFRKATFTID